MSRTVTQTATRAATVAPAPAPAAPGAAPSAARTAVLISDKWYDLTAWKHTHPGGALILEQMHGCDATDAFYSLHSPEAAARLQRLPSSSTIPAFVDRAPPPPTKATVAFRAFRAQLEREGWFKRSWAWEAFYTGSVYVLGILGTWLALTGHPILAILAVGLCMQQAGWIGHDHIHARGAFSYWNGLVLQWVNGFSRAWWSNKHNTHHVFTNYIGVDADIENDPVFHLFFPDPKDDTIFRKMQHWYFVPVAAFLYVSWRIQSLQHSFRTMDWKELLFQAVNYAWLYVLGWQVALASIYLGGGLVAVIVTATHQSEEFISADSDRAREYSFCEGQFLTTRDARTSDPFTEWLWGGMQYQLEHHLFPTMPKYRYAALTTRVAEFAKQNGIEYRVDDGQWKIFKRNFSTLKFFSGDKSKKQ